MPEQKTCPFKLCVASSKEKLCNKSECEIWSTELTRCSIFIGMKSLLLISESFILLNTRQT